MKKILLFALFCTVSVLSFGQLFTWQSFDSGQMPPSGWTFDSLPAQWSSSNSNTAGGIAPEAKFTYTDGTFVTRLISPMYDLSGVTGAKFAFTHYYDFYTSPAPKVGVATRSHNGAWTSVYEFTPTATFGPTYVDITLNSPDIGQDEFQICVYLNGNMYNLNYYYCDNMLLYTPLNLDAGILSLSTTPTYLADPVQVKGMIMNLGTSSINTAEINWQLDAGVIHTETLTNLSLAQQHSIDFACTDLMGATIGSHNLKVWISKVNGDVDDNHADDTLVKTVNRVCHVIQRVPLLEEFTSSTCAPCASFNTDFVPWCNNHDSTITLIKYQMNWPGAGDPYYTGEGGVRRDYYGVGFVPDLYTNGAEGATDVTTVQTAYDMARTQIGMMAIKSSSSLTGHSITVDATIVPFTNFASCHIFIVVMEKMTYNNTGTNGETSFEHVMMKMLPDANGTALNLTDRVPYTIHQVADLTGTNVERWDDLIVGIIIQDDATKEVYQSGYTVENGIFNTEARLSKLLVNMDSIVGFNSDIMTYTIQLPHGSNIPDVAGIPIDPKETVIVIPAIAIPGTTTIDVFDESLLTHNVYTVNFTSLGVNDNRLNDVNVYPNPSSGMISIYGTEHSTITIYSGNGTLYKTITDFTGTVLNLNELSKGVYILNIQKEDNTVIRKKVVLL